MQRIGTKEINGVVYEIHAGPSGIFSILEPSVDGAEKPRQLGSGDTLDKAVANARAQINKEKVKLNIPFITIAGEHGVATGLHGRTRKILVTVEGQKMQLGGYEGYLRADTPKEDVERLVEVSERIRKLEAEKREIISEYKFDLMSEVGRQIREAVRDEDGLRRR